MVYWLQNNLLLAEDMDAYNRWSITSGGSLDSWVVLLGHVLSAVYVAQSKSGPWAVWL
jgi:hypothetical protein